jgi:glycosyltransferase involved in cell wall biosynthesis
MKTLAVIPSDPIDAYIAKGTSSWLQEYYNPLHFFDEVYLLSPLEKKERNDFGMTIIPTARKQLKRRIKEFDINVVRAYGGYWACDMACKNKVKGVPVVVSVHDTNEEILFNSIKKADFVFCVSDVVRKIVLKNYPYEDRCWILPNRVNFREMVPYSKKEKDNLNKKYQFKFKILHVGRKSVQKNLDTLLKALNILGSEYCLLTVGRGDIDYYKELARGLDVIDRCFFIDVIPNNELAKYYSWADCMCVPSRWEGFGLVFIEALACEAIVITSNIAPMNEYIKNRENGLLVDEYESPDILAQTIKIACNSEALRSTLQNNSRKSIERFEKKQIDQLEASYYKQIISIQSSLHK